jgi:hypothetical protein
MLEGFTGATRSAGSERMKPAAAFQAVEESGYVGAQRSVAPALG